METQFVTYEIAKKLKELGFNEPCLAYHRELLGSKEPIFHLDAQNKPFVNSELGENKYNMVAAPLWQQAIEWLRTKYTIDIVLDPVIHIFRFDIYKKYRVIGAETGKNINAVREKAILKAIYLEVGH